MGANGDAGYLISGSALDFLVDTDERIGQLLVGTDPHPVTIDPALDHAHSSGSNTPAAIRHHPRRTGTPAAGSRLASVPATPNTEVLPVPSGRQARRIGVSRFHQIACGRTGPLR